MKESERPFEDHTDLMDRYTIDDFEQAEFERRFGASSTPTNHEQKASA